MSDMRAEVRGLEKLQKTTERFVAEMEGGLFLQAMRKATLIVQRTAKRKVPVDTGRLRASITPEVRKTQTSWVGVVGSNVQYAPYVELGTVRMAARPYLQPAITENQREIFDILGNAVAQITRESGGEEG